MRDVLRRDVFRPANAPSVFLLWKGKGLVPAAAKFGAAYFSSLPGIVRNLFGGLRQSK